MDSDNWFKDLHEAWNKIYPHSERKFRMALWLEETQSKKSLELMLTGVPRPFSKMRSKFSLAFLAAMKLPKYYRDEFTAAEKSGWTPQQRDIESTNT